MGRRTSVRMFVIAALLLLSACDANVTGKTYPPYRYRLTAEVQTPEGLKTGTGVIEVQWNTAGRWLGTQGGAGFRVRGEAVPVDLPRGQTLFVLLRSKSDIDWAAYTHQIVAGEPPGGPINERADRWSRYFQKVLADRKIHELRGYPILVRFENVRDLTSVKEVDPESLEDTFGPGVKMLRLSVQITTEPVSSGIKQRLPWLQTHRGALKKVPPDTPLSDSPFASTINEGDFVKEG